MWPQNPPEAGLSAPILFHQLIQGSGGDGLTADIPFPATRAEDLHDLMEAWSKERSELIETKIVLERIEKLLARLISDEPLSPTSARRARRLLDAIAHLEKRR